MQHGVARQIIARLLVGSDPGSETSGSKNLHPESGIGLGLRAVLLTQAAELHDKVPSLAPLWELALAQPPEMASLYTGPLNQLAIPGEVSDLLTQLAPLVIAHPSDTGLNLSLLAMLADLWPHVASDERPLLRVRFLNGLMERAGAVGIRSGIPREAIVTSAELKVWNRYMPTATGEAVLADLPRILSAPTAQAAYHLLADHLIGEHNGGILAHILGSLTMQVADQSRDVDGILLSPLSGAMATEQIAVLCPAEIYATLLSQLAHQVWWCVNGGSLSGRSGHDHGTAPATGSTLSDSILSGQTQVARRLARALAHDDATWWAAVTPALVALGSRSPVHLQRTINAAWTLCRRSHQRVIAADDLSGVAAILTDGV